MRKIVLFIAMSLDGFIADKEGRVDWLGGQSETEETKDVYSDFIRDIDTVVMGWNTYHQVVTELSPGEWVYAGMKSYVITHRKCESTEEIEFTGEAPADLIERLKCQTGKDVWICGGADIIRQLVRENAIDKYYISVIPTLLGNGIRLFGDMEFGTAETKKEIRLALVQTQHYNGIVDLVYERR